MQAKKNEIWIGVFVLIALCAIVFICLQVANIKSLNTEPTYRIYAVFDDVGGLKIRSPVKLGGVVIGRVANIELDTNTYTPRVTLNIQKKYHHIPNTSTLAIRTTGLLGEQYLALNIGFEDPNIGTTILKDGDTIQDTKSAIVLEDLVGQFLYKNDNTKLENLTPDIVTPRSTVISH